MKTRMLSLLGAVLIAAVAPRTMLAQGTNGRVGLRSADAVQLTTPSATAPLGGSLNMPRAGGHGQAVTLMIVGGAGMLGGLIVNSSAGNAIAIGGLLVGLYGLYLYLR